MTFYLHCVLDVHTIYQSFINSTNNNFKMFNFNNQSHLVKSYKSDGNLRHNRGYFHLVDVDSIPDFDIGPFVQKFVRSPARHFGVHTNSDKKWSGHQIQLRTFHVIKAGLQVHFASNGRSIVQSRRRTWTNTNLVKVLSTICEKDLHE